MKFFPRASKENQDFLARLKVDIETEWKFMGSIQAQIIHAQVATDEDTVFDGIEERQTPWQDAYSTYFWAKQHYLSRLK